mgnify:CR=1 FL=1
MILTLVAVTLTWTQPATRTDGTNLDAGSISHYVLYRNGEEWDATTTTSHETTRNGTYSVRCVLSDGVVSAASNSVSVRIKGKGKKK